MADDKGDKAEFAWHEAAIKRLNERVPNAGTCPACDEKKVTMGRYLVTPLTTTRGGTPVLTGTQYPQLMLLCSNCGFTRYFNHILLMESPEKESEPDA